MASSSSTGIHHITRETGLDSIPSETKGVGCCCSSSWLYRSTWWKAKIISILNCVRFCTRPIFPSTSFLNQRVDEHSGVESGSAVCTPCAAGTFVSKGDPELLIFNALGVSLSLSLGWERKERTKKERHLTGFSLPSPLAHTHTRHTHNKQKNPGRCTLLRRIENNNNKKGEKLHPFVFFLPLFYFLFFFRLLLLFLLSNLFPCVWRHAAIDRPIFVFIDFIFFAMQLLLEYDDQSWDQREWTHIHQTGVFHVFLVEHDLWWAGTQQLSPALVCFLYNLLNSPIWLVN